jgi:hypothetical protein
MRGKIPGLVCTMTALVAAGCANPASDQPRAGSPEPPAATGTTSPDTAGASAAAPTTSGGPARTRSSATPSPSGTGSGSALPSSPTDPGAHDSGSGKGPGRTKPSTSRSSSSSGGGCPATATGRTGNRRNQAISFGALGTREYPAAQINLAACSSSGLPVRFSLSTNSNCVLAGSKLSAEAAPADCTVMASQPGDATFAAAPPVTRPFHVGLQQVNGHWGGPGTATHLSAGMVLHVHVVVSSKSNFQVGDVAVSGSPGVCDGADAGEVDGAGTRDVTLNVLLLSVGPCTLTLILQGNAPSAANVADPPRTYTVS